MLFRGTMPVQQPRLRKPVWDHGARPGVRAQLLVRRLPSGALLWARLSAVCLEAAQARVCSIGGSSSKCHTRSMSLSLLMSLQHCKCKLHLCSNEP